MSDKFTQGTIIEYIRSTKYPEIKCQGIRDFAFNFFIYAFL